VSTSVRRAVTGGPHTRLALVLPVVPVRPKRMDDYAEAAGREAVHRVCRAAEPLRGAGLLQIEDGVTGYLVGDTLACAEAIIRLLEEPNLGERMGEAARSVVRERFLTTRELEDHLQLLGRLAA
jgi:hypothetical protein